MRAVEIKRITWAQSPLYSNYSNHFGCLFPLFGWLGLWINVFITNIYRFILYNSKLWHYEAVVWEVKTLEPCACIIKQSTGVTVICWGLLGSWHSLWVCFGHGVLLGSVFFRGLLGVTAFFRGLLRSRCSVRFTQLCFEHQYFIMVLEITVHKT